MLLRSVWAAVAFALLTLTPGCGQAAESAAVHADAAVTPAPAFDAAGLARFDAALADRADRQVRAGYAAILIRNGESHIATAGLRDIASGAPMLADTPVRIASMSKPVTALAVMMLIESGQIALDDPVSDYIPAFATTGVAAGFEPDADGNFATVPQAIPMTVRHLLTHTAGVGYIFETDTGLGRAYAERTLYQGDGDLEAKIDELATLPLYFQPGGRWFYSYSNDILGRIVEVASGMPFQDFLQTRIFDPLDMTATTFFPTDEEVAAAAAVYLHGEDGGIYPVFSEENPEYRPGWASGGGGLISTATDYARFASMLLGGGELDGVRLVEPATVTAMTSPQVSEAQLGNGWSGVSYGFGLRMVLPGDAADPEDGRPGDFSWGGLFDTDFFVSPSTGLVAVMMTQELPTAHTPEGRTKSWWREAAYQTLSQPE